MFREESVGVSRSVVPACLKERQGLGEGEILHYTEKPESESGPGLRRVSGRKQSTGLTGKSRGYTDCYSWQERGRPHPVSCLRLYCLVSTAEKQED